MSIKLKSIEIEAFRVYKDKQTFNFEYLPGHIANLIVLYAPNGFGKTSFFDAVEWGITGEISRISKNSNVKKIADEEQGNILKNTESEKEYGIVKILGEEDNILEVHTKTVGVRNRKTDYCIGDPIKVTPTFQKLKKIDVCASNLLAHDKIDAFLRFSNPRERYDTLSNFWDANKDTQAYKTILAIYKEAAKKEEETELEISRLEKELANIPFSPEKVSHLISLIKSFNNSNKLQMILDESLQNDVKNNLDKCMEYRTKIANLNNQFNSKIVIINTLKQEFPQYVDDNSKILLLREKAKEKTGIIEKFGQLTKKEQTIKELEEQNKGNRIKLEKYNELIINWPEFDRISKTTKEIVDKNYLVNKEITELSGNNQNYELELLNLTNVVKETEELLSKYQKLQSEVDLKYTDYFNLKKRQKFQNNRILLIKKLTEVRTKYINDLSVQVNELKGYCSLDNKMLLENEYNYSKYKDEYIKCKNIYNEYLGLKELLQMKEKEYIDFGKLNEQLNLVIKHGKTFIEQTKVKRCPLCNKEYQDFNKLLESVNNSFEDILGINKISAEIDKTKSLLNTKEIQLNELIIEFKKLIEDEIKQINSKINTEKEKINNYSNITSKKRNLVNEYNGLINEITKYLVNNDIDITANDIDQIKNGLQGKIENQKEVNNQLAQKVETLKTNLKSNQELIITKKNEVDIRNAKINEFKSEPTYIKTISLLEQLNINLNSANLDVAKKQLEATIMKRDEEILSIRNAISELQNELINQNSDEIEETLAQYKNEINIISEKIKSFVNRYKSFIDNNEENISIQSLEYLSSQVESELKTNEDILKILIEISEHLDYLQKNKEILERKAKIAALDKELELIRVAEIELSKAKDTSIQYITDRINNYFNIDIINQIYGKIDPHPELKYIKFEPEFSKDMPELNIHAYSDDEQRLSPILYLSSAQVNILSLSIFLAKSLQSKDSTLNTIFMDDPIQHFDSINILSFIDLLRTIITEMDRQIVLSTHNDSFFKLIKRKIDPEYFNAKYLELRTYGLLKQS